MIRAVAGRIPDAGGDYETLMSSTIRRPHGRWASAPVSFITCHMLHLSEKAWFSNTL